MPAIPAGSRRQAAAPELAFIPLRPALGVLAIFLDRR